MAVALTVNGQTFDYPEQGDQAWGPSATDWASAVTTGMLQKAGGLFQLLSEVDFGSTYGVKSLYIKSRSANVASAGQLRLARTDVISWRNAANDGDLNLSVDAGNNLLFNGSSISPYITAVGNTSTISLTVNTGSLTADVNSNSITNAMINSSAAIARSKLANGTANRLVVNDGSGVMSDAAAITAARALISDANGIPTHSSVTSTELGYVSGVTSALQTQLNSLSTGKLSLSGGTMTGTLNMGTNVISNVVDPSNPQDAATKAYVDNIAQGLNAKAAVVVATTGNITLSGEQTIDGVLTSASRVLVKNQSNQTQNGIYVSSAGAWTRSTDADTWNELVSAFVFVSQGTTQADTGWVCTIDPGGVIGVNNITFVQFSSAGIILAGAGLTKTGNTLSVNVDNSTIEISGNNLRVVPLGINNAQIGTSAAIALSKLAALTASRALVSDGSGVISVSSVTSTELGYVAGVTSAIQTQLNGKMTNPMTTGGDVIYGGASGTPTRLANGSSGNVLTSSGGTSAPTWSDPTLIRPAVSTISSGPTNVVAGDTNKIFLVDTSAARTFNLPAPSAGLRFTFKDKTGSAQTNNITIVRNASEQIEGVAASKIFQTNWGSWTIVSDGTNWFIV